MVLTRVIEWSKEINDRRWVTIEHSLCNRDLSHIIWNPPKFRALGTETAALTHNSLKIWDQVHTQNKWTYNSPLIYLKENIFFEPGRREVGGNWIKRDSTQLKDVIREGKICTYSDLKDRSENFSIDPWRYLQLSFHREIAETTQK